MIKFILIILDGFGLRKEEKGNAVAQANTPNLDKMMNNCPLSKIKTSGFKSLDQSDKKLLREYFILKQPERKIADNYQVHVSTISRRIHKVCSKLSTIFFNLAKSDFNLDENEAKEMFHKFGNSWHSNVAEILT